MSYIIKSNSPFVSVKLTERGRESLSKGQLTFSSWAIGDSEINYQREEIVDSNQLNPTLSGSSRILRPVDRQPDFTSFITPSSGVQLNALNSSNINVVKAVVNNEAKERGFFSGNSLIYETLVTPDYVSTYTSTSNLNISGGTIISIPDSSTFKVGDFVRLKLTNDANPVTLIENETPLPNLWFKIQSTATTGNGFIDLTLDRSIPNISSEMSSNSYIIIYPNGEVYNTYGYETATAYWDSGTLSFDSATNITCDDVKVWNMNNVWCENLAGITGLSTTNLYEDYTKFGSFDYLGSKYPYFRYPCTSSDLSSEFDCNGTGVSVLDGVNKSVSILHYTNNTISNLYGEFFYIDLINDKTLRITLPDLMYHRRGYATGSGTTMGMSFVASGATSLLEDTDIEFINLYEDSSLIGDKTPNVVGKVFTQFKTVVIEDDEIVAALSYKSNRNWTLPELSANIINPTGGTNNGILGVNKTMYLTYILENDGISGLTTSLGCQKYVKILNNTSSSKDISFKISDIDLLPYMRKIESLGYDGMGFNAKYFKLVYQIVDSPNDRPDPGNWRVYDFTSTAITGGVGETIDPLLLENQTSTSNGFILTNGLNSASTTFDITQILSLAPNTDPDALQFGDERFFYGNLETYIGATIYKTIFDLRVNPAQFTLTTNSTRSQQVNTNPPVIKVSEVGVYDNNNNLVIIGKLSKPVPLTPGNTIMFELSVDF